MERFVLGMALVSTACRPSEPAQEPEGVEARASEIEARANEVEARLLAECQTGDESACRRLGVSAPGTAAETQPAEDYAPDDASEEHRVAAPRPLELDSWPGGATGLFLGSTPSEIVEQCGILGGTAALLRSDQTPVGHPSDVDDGGTIVCMGRRKFDPLRRGGSLDAFLLLTSELVIVNFCLFDSNLTACELHFDPAEDSHHFARELLRKIEEQFGPIRPAKADFNCRLASDAKIAFRGTWDWTTTQLDGSGRPFPVGSLLMNYGCTPVVERPQIFLVLRDTVGMLRATGLLQGGRIVR